MSVSSVGSSNAYAYLQWPSPSDGVDGGNAGDASPTDALQSLYQAFTGGNPNDPLIQALGSDDGSGNSGGGSFGVPQFSAAAMSALLSAQSGKDTPAANRAQDRLQELISKFDTDGNGQISQSEFETAIGSGADQSSVDALFSKLDGNGDGSISQDELQTALQQAHGGGHHHHHVEDSSGGGQGGDPLQALLSGATADGTTSQTSSNADGSTTTSITYADGTKLEMTTPATSSDSSNGGSDPGAGNANAFSLGNLLKLMVSLQARLAPPTADLSA